MRCVTQICVKSVWVTWQLPLRALSPEVHNPHNHDDYDNADADEDDDGDDDDTNGCGDDGGDKQEDGDDDYGDGVIYTHFDSIRMTHKDSAELVRCLHKKMIHKVVNMRMCVCVCVCVCAK